MLSILTYAELAGMSTGIISTTRVTHATPAAFFSQTPSRQWENDQAAKGNCIDICKIEDFIIVQLKTMLSKYLIVLNHSFSTTVS